MSNSTTTTHKPLTPARARRLAALELYDNHTLGAAVWAVWGDTSTGQYPALDENPDAVRDVLTLVHQTPNPSQGIATESELSDALAGLTDTAALDFYRLIQAAWLTL